MFLKNSPIRGIMRFIKRGKLSLRYIGPFEILKNIREVACKLALPPNLSRVHTVFHMSMLRRYISDPSHITELLTIELNEDLSYKE